MSNAAAENDQDDSLRLGKRSSHDKRREGKGSAHTFDGPVLRPKPHRIPHLSVSRSVGEDDDPISYAQALTATHYAQPHQSIQLAYSTSLAIGSNPESEARSLAIDAGRQRSSTFASQEEVGEMSSSIPPSIFDGVDSEEERLQASDFETDISSLSNSDYYEIPPDVDRDDRLTSPTQYFGELEDLEASIAGNSGLFLMSTKNRRAYPDGRSFNLRFPFECHSTEIPSEGTSSVSFDEQVMNYCSKWPRATFSPFNSGGALDTEGLPYLSFHILECRNLMLSVTSNINRMRRLKYCDNFISVLSLDEKRKNTVNLNRVPLTEVTALHQDLEGAIDCVTSLIGSPRPQRSLRMKEWRDSISTKSKNMLNRCGLPLGSSDVGNWRRLLMVLDLAIMSYSGTHQEDFGNRFLGESLDAAKITPAWTYDTLASNNIMLKRRRLKCLDKLLQSPVWIFQDSSRWEEIHELYLSTDMETFADVWGPVWSVKPKDDKASAVQFRVGSGFVCKWPLEASTPELQPDEVLCHWVPLGERVLNSEHLTPFHGGSRLLIGAGTLVEHTTSQLKETFDCNTRSSKVIQDLQSTNRLEELGTSADEKYLAEECVTAQLGYSGVTLGGQRTYKRRTGVSLKQAIYDAWKNGSANRNPAILEHWIGLEVSFCSGNARRRRLKDVFGCTTIANWLDSCKANDISGTCEGAFHDAIKSRDSRAFRRLWIQHPEWRKDLGQLVSWCLEGLVHSKVDAEGNLHALWIPKSSKRMVVNIKQNRHAWTSFLTDSRDHCSMSVMSGKCLSSDYKYASCCQSKGQLGYSILETALVINEKAPRPESLQLRCGEKEKVCFCFNVHLAPAVPSIPLANTHNSSAKPDPLVNLSGPVWRQTPGAIRSSAHPRASLRPYPPPVRVGARRQQEDV